MSDRFLTVEAEAVKLTPRQTIALSKLTTDWQSAHITGEHLRTLNALVREGLAQRKLDYHRDEAERHCTYYRLTKQGAAHGR